MTARTIASGSAVTVAGALVAAGAYWELLRVPESSVPALMLSAGLALAIVLVLGMTTGVVIALAGGAGSRAAVGRGVRALPGFLIGGLVLLTLLWLTGSIAGQWTLHRGEIDALFLRYASTDRTAWLHAGIDRLMWLLGWGLGLAAIAAATAGIATARGRGAARGLSDALSPRPLGATFAALVAGWGLWSMAYWRPTGLAADATELAFVSVKLGAMFVVASILVVLVLHVFARQAEA